MNYKFNLSALFRVLLMCLTLGLAPFYPEPHIVGKIRWIWGGAVGMQTIDWFDFMLHGAPWFILIGITLRYLVSIIYRKFNAGHYLGK